MCTNLTFRQSDGLDESFQGIKLQSCKTKALGNNADHLLIFRRTGSGIFLQILVCISLQFFYNATCNQFQRALGCRETPSSMARFGISFIFATNERISCLLGVKLRGHVGVYLEIAR